MAKEGQGLNGSGRRSRAQYGRLEECHRRGLSLLAEGALRRHGLGHVAAFGAGPKAVPALARRLAAEHLPPGLCSDGESARQYKRWLFNTGHRDPLPPPQTLEFKALLDMHHTMG